MLYCQDHLDVVGRPLVRCCADSVLQTYISGTVMSYNEAMNELQEIATQIKVYLRLR